jgi:hypothetical protein
MNTNEVLKLALVRLQARTDTADLDAIGALNEALAEQPTYRAVKTFHEGKPVYVAEQSARPTVPDALTPADKESPEYTDGWNDCRQAMLAS